MKHKDEVCLTFLLAERGGVCEVQNCVTQCVPLGLQGDFTWNSMSGRSVRLRSVPIQSLSELERARLQEVAFYQLQQDCELSCQIAIPKGKALPAVPWGVLRARQLLRQSRRLNTHLTPDTPEGNAASWWLAAISVHVGRHIQVAQFTCQLICLKGRSSWA